MKRLLIVVLLVAVDATALAAEKPVLLTTTVHGTGDRTCRVFLAVPSPGTRGAPVALSLLGTGEYTRAESWKGPDAASVLGAGAGWLAFDKPGIVADPAAPGGYRVEDQAYDAHTVEDLERCAAEALAWAAKRPQVGGASPVVIRGHSEGALVAARLLGRLHAADERLAARVSALVLSGTPVAPMGEVFWKQVKARGRAERYEKALAEGDDAFVRAQAGIGAGTLRGLMALPSLGETLFALAAHRPATRIALFHGTEDRNAPVEDVRALVRENSARLEHGEPALELTARYYGAGHGLDAGAVEDLALWTLDALRPDGYLRTAERESAGPTAVAVPEAKLAAVVGRYRIDDGMELEVTREGHRLFAQATGQPRFPIYFAAEGRLVTRSAPVELEVEHEGGRVPALILVQGGRRRCPRVD